MSKKINIALLSMLLLVPASTATAQPRLSAQSIIINPTQAELTGRVWLDRQASTDGSITYTEGEKISIKTNVNRDAYVYLFNIDAAGQVSMIIPNGYTPGEEFLRAGEIRTFPDQNSRYSLSASAPYGASKVLMVASLEPLNISSLNRITGSNKLSMNGQEKLAQALSIVVSPVPEKNWTTSSISYKTVAKQEVGTLKINSNIQTKVYIDGKEAGNTTNTFTLNSGTHNVELRAQGYPEWKNSVNIKANSLTTLNVNLKPTQAAPVQRVPTTPGTSTPKIADLFTGLLGSMLQPQISPLQTTHQERINELQGEGWKIISQQQNSSELQTTLQKDASTLIVSSRKQDGRIIKVTEEKTTSYRY